MPVRKRLVAACLAVTAFAVVPAVATAKPPDPLPAPCERPNPPATCFAGTPTGTLSSAVRTPQGLVVVGTAQDPDASGPVEVSVEVDGTQVGRLTTSYGAFSGTITPRAGSEVCAWALNRNRGDDALLGCRPLSMGVNPLGHLDEVIGGSGGVRIRGWAIDPDTTAPVIVEVLVDGYAPIRLTASQSRPDVGAAYPPYGNAHGFDTTLSVKGHPRVCVRAVNVGPGYPNVEIGCAIATQALPPAPAGVHTMSVATLNVIGNDQTAANAGLPGFDDRLEMLAEAVRGLDVVALQEVASADQVVKLAARAEFPYYTTGGASGAPDLALMSKVPLTGVRRDAGPKPGCWLGIDCGGPVWILTATVELSGMPVRVINTHLSGDYHNEDGNGTDRTAWRAAQAAFIKDMLVAPFGGRVVVVGDFNGNDDLVAPRGPLADAGATAPYMVQNAAGETHCGDRIDLILPRPPIVALAYDGVYGGVCAPAGLSDHPLVSALLALDPPQQPPPPGPTLEPVPAPPSPAVCLSKPWTPGC